MSSVKPRVIFVLGGPGSGKGTTCSELVKEFGYRHLSAGDLLREERGKAGSQYGELIESHITNGTIVPVEITCKLIERAMQQSKETTFLIDGFPRNKDNLDGWLKDMGDKTKLLFVLVLECPLDTCMQRCLGRGAGGSGRTDDNEESLKKRIITFQNDTLPIIEHYEKQNIVKKVDSSQPKSKMHEDVRKIIEEVDKLAT